MPDRILVTTISLLALLTATGIAWAQPCTPAECMSNGMCTIDGECVGTPVSGGSCDDFDSCTVNDTCMNGQCVGVPTSVGSCDDFNPCTMNDQCSNGMCVGTPRSNGAACGDPGCQGTCLVVPFGPTICMPNLAVQNQPCTDQVGNCTTNDRCLGFVCTGNFRLCPNVDGNPCTIEFCNVQTGQCENTSFSPCGECQTCDLETGDCLGGPPATPTATRTGAVATATATRTQTAATPTVTMTAATATATLPAATPTRPEPGPCVADCSEDGRVSVDEVVLATQIALGVALLQDCEAADFSGEDHVSVDELLQGVQALLVGCVD